jgi:ABC-type dipeptide/oligopeptide/nickel transport system permease component
MGLLEMSRWQRRFFGYRNWILKPAASYVARRLALALITVIGISFVSFTTVYLLPGDPVSSRFPQASEAELARMRAEMGLDRPLHVQYVNYVAAIAHGNLGWSYNTGTPVEEDIVRRLPASLELSIFALVIAIGLGVPLGMASAVHRNTPIDHVARLFSIGALSAPVFWTGLVSIFVFSYVLDWVPPPLGRLTPGVFSPASVTGFLTIDAALAGDLKVFSAAAASLFLPSLVLGISLIAPISRMTRSAMSEALQEDYILFARATGVPEREVVLRDAFQGSIVPLLTVVGYLIGYLVAGNALVESVFAWPGIGRYAVQAILANDMAPINAILLILGITVAVANLLVDLANAAIDPRIRLGLWSK